MASFAVSKDTLMKVGIAAAVAIIVYLILRSRSCTARREQYAMFAAPRRRDGYAPYIHRTRSKPGTGRRRRRREGYAMFAAPRDDEAVEMLESLPAPADDYAEVTASLKRANDPLGSHLMQPTLEDDEANAVFSPDS